jgi:hypothetical protein
LSDIILDIPFGYAARIRPSPGKRTAYHAVKDTVRVNIPVLDPDATPMAILWRPFDTGGMRKLRWDGDTCWARRGPRTSVHELRDAMAKAGDSAFRAHQTLSARVRKQADGKPDTFRLFDHLPEVASIPGELVHYGQGLAEGPTRTAVAAAIEKEASEMAWCLDGMWERCEAPVWGVALERYTSKVTLRPTLPVADESSMWVRYRNGRSREELLKWIRISEPVNENYELVTSGDIQVLMPEATKAHVRSASLDATCRWIVRGFTEELSVLSPELLYSWAKTRDALAKRRRQCTQADSELGTAAARMLRSATRTDQWEWGTGGGICTPRSETGCRNRASPGETCG